MMKDVDGLNIFYEPEIAEFLKVAAILRSDDAKKRPDAYNRNNFQRIGNTNKGKYGECKESSCRPTYDYYR